MQERRNPSSFFSRFLLGFAIAMLAIGGGTAWFAWHSLKSPSQKSDPTTRSVTPAPTEPSTEEAELAQRSQQQAQVYWLENDGEHLILTSHLIAAQKDASTQAVLESALMRLLSGPSDTQQVTTIPPKTKLLSLKITAQGIYIDLSEEFTAGNGSASLSGRLGQILYTATSLDEKASVWISIAGEPLTSLGDGLGLEIDQPMTRAMFEKDFEL